MAPASGVPMLRSASGRARPRRGVRSGRTSGPLAATPTADCQAGISAVPVETLARRASAKGSSRRTSSCRRPGPCRSPSRVAGRRPRGDTPSRVGAASSPSARPRLRIGAPDHAADVPPAWSAQASPASRSVAGPAAGPAAARPRRCAARLPAYHADAVVAVAGDRVHPAELARLPATVCSTRARPALTGPRPAGTSRTRPRSSAAIICRLPRG